jgi:hypothetical protein
MTEMRQFAATQAARLRRLLRPAEAPPLDLRGLALHPLEAKARAKNRRYVMDLPLALCRGHRAAAFPCVPGAGHPYLETARALLADPALPYEATPLARYYACFQPATAADYLGVASAHPLLLAPPAAVFLPWHPPPPPDLAQTRRAALERENRAHGAPLAAGHGFHHYGPVSPAKGALELSRLTSVLDCIKAEGFRLLPGRSGLPRAQLLTAGDDWRALVGNGQHRVAALAALGHATAPFWPLPDPVRREDADAWPSVRAGVFTPAQALAIFDRLFAGRQPAALDPAYWT